MFTLVYNLFTRSLMVLLVAMLSVNYLPNNLFDDFPLEPKSMESVDFDSVIPQNWNSQLSDKAEYIQLNNILGPESIAISKEGLLYTGLADGRLVELDPSKSYKLRQVLRFKQSKECLDNVATRATECGRFLQVRFLNNTLYALESNSGLYKIDIKTGVKTFVGPKLLKKVNIFNSFVFDPKEPNLVYITISSTKWDLQRIVWSLIDFESTGYLLALDINTGKRAIILDEVIGPNGIDVDEKRDQLIYSQTLLAQINSLSLKEIRAAFKVATDGQKLSSLKKSTVIPIVPGNPDNIIVQGDLAYIALPFVRLNGKEIMDNLAPMPSLRKAYGRITYGVGRLLQYVCENLYYHELLDSAYKELKSGHVNYRIFGKDKSAVIEYNLSTRTSRLLGSDAFSFISEAVPDNKGNLFLGSFRSPFIVKVKV